MGDVAQGIKAFKKGMSEDEKAEDDAQGRAGQDHRPSAAVDRGAAIGSGAPATAGAPSDTRKVG